MPSGKISGPELCRTDMIKGDDGHTRADIFAVYNEKLVERSCIIFGYKDLWVIICNAVGKPIWNPFKYLIRLNARSIKSPRNFLLVRT